MIELYKDVALKYPLRDYQSRVLEQMQYMLRDGHLHISAAPGAGKTVLGLEAIRRLNTRALILVPTINLRNQWKERFLSHFVDDKNGKLLDYWKQNFSTDLMNPGIITCSTYQALYQLYDRYSAEKEVPVNPPESKERTENTNKIENTNKTESINKTENTNKTENAEIPADDAVTGKSGRTKDPAELIKSYKALGIKTICLDEAHHLKREWWKVLTEFVGEMDAMLIALTATPPMDTSNLEWKRYISLCGDIDLEISIPEMVIRKCLCPHQDYLYICKPTEAEEARVKQEMSRNRECEMALLKNRELYNAVKALPFFRLPEENTDIILKNPDYIARLIKYAAYIKATCIVELEESRFNAETAYDIWDIRIKNMVLAEEADIQGKQPDTSWFLPLMKDILENDPENYPEELRAYLKEVLTNNHLIKDGKVKPRFDTEKTDRILKQSASKLNAIVDIIESESQVCGTELRALVLMDHIRKEDISKIETAESLTDMGVSSVFERLRRKEHMGNLEKYFERDTADNPVEKRVYRARLGVLTGSLVILPDKAIEELQKDNSLKLKVKPLGVTGYSSVEASSDSSDMIVSKVTDIFQRGLVEVLIGTAALLGEGWDAPMVNTLIIGSNSGTYVKTNQMRGRALRIPGENRDKVSNIWHLMTVSEDVYESSEERTMRQRFDSIVGLSMDGRRIENGIERLCLDNISMQDSKRWNECMMERSRNRLFVKERWEAALMTFSSAEVRSVTSVQEKRRDGVSSDKSCLKTKEIMALSDGIYRVMKNRQIIAAESKLTVRKNADRLEFYLQQTGERDGRLYADCLRQALDEIIYPKYLIRFGFFRKRYCPVPDMFAGKQEDARAFRLSIKGARELIPTNTDRGKAILLKQRLSNTSSSGIKVMKELMS